MAGVVVLGVGLFCAWEVCCHLTLASILAFTLHPSPLHPSPSTLPPFTVDPSTDRRHNSLHEKPFAGINGSGKHNNWGLNTDTGDNLFVPGKTEHKQARFIALVACLARTIHVHGDTLRASVGTAGNDHRLGAQEAPPAIMSLYTGLEMEKHLQAVIDGGDLAGYNPPAKSIDVGSPAVQVREGKREGGGGDGMNAKR